MSDVTKTPREELECKKKYLYEYSMFWECNDGSKCQILEDDVVRLLNEQQAIIRRDKMSIKTMMSNMEKLEKENKELVKNFDDLVNWASEIAKRNVILDEKIGKLQRENEQLRNELGDCEKFRYTVFKRLNDEYKKECSIK